MILLKLTTKIDFHQEWSCEPKKRKKKNYWLGFVSGLEEAKQHPNCKKESHGKARGMHSGESSHRERERERTWGRGRSEREMKKRTKWRDWGKVKKMIREWRRDANNEKKGKGGEEASRRGKRKGKVKGLGWNTLLKELVVLSSLSLFFFFYIHFFILKILSFLIEFNSSITITLNAKFFSPITNVSF